MNLDVNTPRGQDSITDELAAVALFETAYPNYRYLHTNKKLPAKADAIILKDGL